MDFATLYQRYWPEVLRFALYLCGEHAEAEDLTADAFVRAWMSGRPIRLPTVKAYLFMIVRNLYRDRLRRLARRRPAATAAAAGLDLPLADGRPGPDRTAAARNELQSVLGALQRLAEDDRAVLAMSAFDEMPHDRIAAALGLSVAAVKVRLHRARLKLAAELQRQRLPEPTKAEDQP